MPKNSVYRVEISDDVAKRIRRAIELDKQIRDSEDIPYDEWHKLKEERDRLRDYISTAIEWQFKDLPF